MDTALAKWPGCFGYVGAVLNDTGKNIRAPERLQPSSEAATGAVVWKVMTKAFERGLAKRRT